MTLRDDYVERLEAENEDLRERVRILEEMIGIRIEVPIVFGLTAHEAALFGLLWKREMITKEAALEGLYGHRPNETEKPEIKIIDVFICKMRRKVKRFGIEIETVWGRGYRMPPESKAVAAQLVEEARGIAPVPMESAPA